VSVKTAVEIAQYITRAPYNMHSQQLCKCAY